MLHCQWLIDSTIDIFVLKKVNPLFVRFCEDFNIQETQWIVWSMVFSTI